MNTVVLRTSIILYFILGFTCLMNQSLAQKITPLQTSYHTDSSFYDIVKIGPNEFWAGGENGVLKRIDSSGNIRNIPFPNKEINILKIVPWKSYVYLAADQGNLYRYDTQTNTFIHGIFSKSYNKLCFYDMIILDDGTILVSGGHNKIAKGIKTIPHGFIARLDADLQLQPEKVWHDPFSFVWSLLYLPESEEILAAGFNGVKSAIMSSVDLGTSFQKKETIKGLIHHLSLHEGAVWYSGSEGISYGKTGIIGQLGASQTKFEGEGCIWSLFPVHGQLLGLSYSGAVMLPDEATNYTASLRPAQKSLYEAVAISSSHALIVGHGRTLYLMDIDGKKPIYTASGDPSQEEE